MALDKFTGTIADIEGVDFGAAAEADFNAAVDLALNTAIPGSPTANSINERIATLDDGALSSADVQAAALAAIRDILGGGAANYGRQVTKTTTFENDDLFTYTGRVMIVSITGFVTVIAGAATTLRLGITPDATAIQYMCAASASAAYGVGTLFTITGTATDAMVGTTLVGAAPSQAASWTAGCITSGKISLVCATQTGTVIWQVAWIPLTAGATLVAA